MKTQRKVIDPEAADPEIIEEAAEIIKKGELVAFPTETVYGLGGDGLNPAACKKIFETKGRPADNPLILHITDPSMIETLTEGKLSEVRRITDRFWPGPLTLIFKKKDIVPDIVTAGGDTVALRNPSGAVARALIDAAGTPIAAPSANLSGRPSPTNGGDCYEDLKGRIPMVLDGGPSTIGIESTVLDVTGEEPFDILRPGFYTEEDFENIGIDVRYDVSILREGEIPKSPGQKYKHYAPKAEVTVYTGDPHLRIEAMKKDAEKYEKDEIGFLLFEEHLDEIDGIVLSLGSENRLEEMANLLFARLREMDRKGVRYIFSEGIDRPGLGISIMNRLRKSSAGRVKKY